MKESIVIKPLVEIDWNGSNDGSRQAYFRQHGIWYFMLDVFTEKNWVQVGVYTSSSYAENGAAMKVFSIFWWAQSTE